MTEIQNSGLEGHKCPSCQTLNHPNSVICVGCGVDIQKYEEVKPELNQIIRKENDKFLKAVQEETQDSIKKDEKIVRLIFVKRLIFLLLLVLVLIPLILVSVKTIQHKKNEQQKILESNYENGIQCYEKKDYRCAEDFLQKVYSQNNNYKDSLSVLLNSKVRIAEELYRYQQISQAITVLESALSIEPQDLQVLIQLNNYHNELGYRYKQEGNWQSAIDEFLSALEANPDDFEARQEIDNVYTLWIQEEQIYGNLFDVWKLRNLQDSFNNK